MVRKDCSGEVLEGDIVGIVLIHVDLFDHHMALGVDLVGAKGGTLDDLGENVEPRRQLLVQDPCPKAGGFLGCESVGLRTYRIEGFRDVTSGELLGSLEKEMLEEMGDTRLVVALVTGSGVDPAAKGHGSEGGHRLRNHSDIVGKSCQVVVHGPNRITWW